MTSLTPPPVDRSLDSANRMVTPRSTAANVRLPLIGLKIVGLFEDLALQGSG